MMNETSGLKAVLIVEDFDAIRTLLGKYFERHSFDIISAGSVQDALILAREQMPEIVIVDFDLRIGDPYRTVSLLHDSLPDSYIVLMNGQSRRSAEDAAHAAGAHQLIDRDVDTTVLDAVLSVSA